MEYDSDQNLLEFSTSTFAMYVYIFLCGDESNLKDTKLRLSNNYFHLSPGWLVKVEILSGEHRPLSEQMKICFKTVYDSVD